jgi:hypothetical protein
MAILSFALTAEEFTSGRKSVTRRDWSDRHLSMWQGLWDTGRLLHQAWDNIPIAGGKPIGELVLTARPYREKLGDMPRADLIAEGGMCSTLQDFCQLIRKSPDDVVAVIRFERVS